MGGRVRHGRGGVLHCDAPRRTREWHGGGAAAPPGIRLRSRRTAIAIAREGFYTDAEVADVSHERLRRFFFRETGGYRVRRELREQVLFAVHNLIKDPPFSHLDLLACRNLLIYLNRSIQERLIDTFHFALRPGGYLFLGTSESPDGASNLFVALDKDAHIYQSRAVASRLAVPLGEPAVFRPAAHHRTANAGPGGSRSRFSHRPAPSPDRGVCATVPGRHRRARAGPRVAERRPVPADRARRALPRRAAADPSGPPAGSENRAASSRAAAIECDGTGRPADIRRPHDNRQPRRQACAARQRPGPRLLPDCHRAGSVDAGTGTRRDPVAKSRGSRRARISRRSWFAFDHSSARPSSNTKRRSRKPRRRTKSCRPRTKS